MIYKLCFIPDLLNLVEVFENRYNLYQLSMLGGVQTRKMTSDYRYLKLHKTLFPLRYIKV